jgi:hypothetical protein
MARRAIFGRQAKGIGAATLHSGSLVAVPRVFATCPTTARYRKSLR